MIERAEVLLVLSRWRDEETRLRFDFSTSHLNISVEGSVGRVESDLVGFLLEENGFIEVFFDNDWGFDYGAPDAAHVPVDARITQKDNRELVQQGAVLVGRKLTSETCLFIEIEAV